MTCHFCDAAHPFDADGVAACKPKKRFQGAFKAALATHAAGHAADCDCPQCENAQVAALLGRVMFLGERPAPAFVGALLARIRDEGWPA